MISNLLLDKNDFLLLFGITRKKNVTKLDSLLLLYVFLYKI